jgi:hypothetical protein
LPGHKALASDQVFFRLVQFASAALGACQQEVSWHVIWPSTYARLEVSDGLGKVPAVNRYLSGLPSRSRLNERGPGMNPAPIRRKTKQTEYNQREQGKTWTAVNYSKQLLGQMYAHKYVNESQTYKPETVCGKTDVSSLLYTPRYSPVARGEPPRASASR